MQKVKKGSNIFVLLTVTLYVSLSIYQIISVTYEFGQISEGIQNYVNYTKEGGFVLPSLLIIFFNLWSSMYCIKYNHDEIIIREVFKVYVLRFTEIINVTYIVNMSPGKTRNKKWRAKFGLRFIKKDGEEVDVNVAMFKSQYIRDFVKYINSKISQN
jgi:hypothetical protein